MADLRTLLDKFQNEWHAGKDARLNFECHAGKVWINLNLCIEHHPPPQQQNPPKRQPGPSRLRRRAKRAAARAAAANAAEDEAPEDEAAAAAEMAVQADTSPPTPTHDIAVQAELAQTVHEPPHGLSAAQAGRPAQAAEQAQPWLHAVLDRFCRDQEFQQAEQASHFLPTQTIPQLDGGPVSGNFADQWSCKCCTYETFFESEDQLEEHHVAHMVEYLECNICYNGHVWIVRN